MKLCIGNFKGGTGKTCTAVHLALGLSRSGRTLLVDADPEQSGAVDWSELAEDWPAEQCTVIACATRDLTRRISPMVGDYEHLVLDTGPKNPVLLRQAIGLAEHVLVPVKPTSHDIPEIVKTFDLAAEADAISPTTAAALLVDVDRRWSSEREARELFAAQEFPTMRSQVRHLRRFAYSRGTAPLDNLGDYEDVLAELLHEEGQ